jgi:hypothetical protein
MSEVISILPFIIGKDLDNSSAISQMRHFSNSIMRLEKVFVKDLSITYVKHLDIEFYVINIRLGWEKLVFLIRVVMH